MPLFAGLARRFEDPEVRLRRREFLQLAAAASASLLVSANPARAAGQRRVLILGAGLAGLACGYELRAAGFDVQILEARSRVGGRVLSFTDFVPGQVVEGGAELVGANHPTWNAYARRFGLKLLEVGEDSDQILELEGQLLSTRAAREVYQELAAAYATLLPEARTVNLAAPWDTPRAVELDSQSMADWLARQKVSARGGRALRAELESDRAVELGSQGYLGMLVAIQAGGAEAYFTDSETHRCSSGNQALAFKLARAIGWERIRLNCPVAEVKYGDSGCRVRLADATVVEGDDVVLTIPPSLWGELRFDPPLRLALPQMGPAVKYLARTSRQPGPTCNSLSDGPVAFTWGSGQALVAFSGGKAARRLRSAGCVADDLYFQEQLARRFPGLKKAFVAGRFMDWPADRFTGAGYSCAAPGAVTGLARRLREGLARLHFAGEYASLEFGGFMEGGLHSGAALARRLAGC